jgi:hypothetical protein
MRRAFVGREKSSSNDSGLRAQCQCSNKSTAIGNSTSRCNRSRRDHVNHAGHECERGHFSRDMTSSFNALCDDYIDICLPSALRLRDRADLMQNLCANRMYALSVCRWVAPEKGNDRYALFQADRDLFLDRKIQNQIYTERFTGELLDTLNFFSKQRRRRELCLQNSQTTGVANGRDKFRPGEIGTHWGGNNRVLDAQQTTERRF